VTAVSGQTIVDQSITQAANLTRMADRLWGDAGTHRADRAGRQSL